MTISPDSIGLSWTAPATGGAPVSYTVLSRVTNSGPFELVATGITGTSYEFTGLIPSTSYDLAVFAVNSGGLPGALSYVTQATQGAVPNAPTGLAASAATPAYADVALSWTAPVAGGLYGAVVSYIVQYALHGSGVWTTAASGVVSTSYTVTGLSHDTTYDFQVIGTNSLGNGAPSGAATLTTDYAPPNAPTISSVAPVPDGSTTKLTVAWTTPATDATHDAATGYNLRYSVHSAGSWTTVTGVTSPYTITGLSSGTSYDVEVQGANASITSPGAWSGITTASTYSVALQWAAVSGAPASSDTIGAGHNIGGTMGTGAMNVQPLSGSPNTVTASLIGQNTTVPTTALHAFSNYGSGPYYWYIYYGTSGFTAGTYYFWAIAEDSGSNVIGALVSSAITLS